MAFHLTERQFEFHPQTSVRIAMAAFSRSPPIPCRAIPPAIHRAGFVCVGYEYNYMYFYGELQEAHAAVTQIDRNNQEQPVQDNLFPV
jgi:hypothetical protein